ncbi:MAG: cytochrome c3 family protein [Candidatus Desulfatibia sp.]|uniref:cytochrome c3 family protein n=1 Tax=Candidatus Desulfatibia sp. TaxID=3101189 RepID=UPI002F2FA70D
MHRIRIGVMCLMMVLILGVSLDAAGQEEAAGQDTDAGEQKLEDMLIPMGVIVIKAHESIEPKRSSVEFDHALHFINDCRICHHKWEGKTQIPLCASAECHDLLKSPKKPTRYLVYTATAILYYKYAYHKMCVGCHKTIKVKRTEMEMSYQVLKEKLPRGGPTGCVECHPKDY